MFVVRCCILVIFSTSSGGSFVSSTTHKLLVCRGAKDPIFPPPPTSFQMNVLWGHGAMTRHLTSNWRCPLQLKGRWWTWVESKASFGDSHSHSKYLEEQFWSYQNRWAQTLTVLLPFSTPLPSSPLNLLLISLPFPLPLLLNLLLISLPFPLPLLLNLLLISLPFPLPLLP